ncbi:peptidylprolyl isomerase [Antribacter gilvus]|uniref:peptidylprolyl isomerase n=1 Tax=Antribacter gilvus TaxID=2304675 RepID=UPI001F0BF1C8|nr:peptidylprolyl isomerase [Antribacter gilvus]
MSTTKQRDRVNAAKRQAKWAERQAKARAHRQRVWTIVAFVAVIAVVGSIAVAAIVTSSDPAGDDTATGASTCPAGSTDSREGYTLAAPEAAEDRTWTVTLQSCSGDTEADITLELDGAAAPQAVASFVTLAQEGYFDGTQCHRLTTDGIYVLQCGDPTATGSGGPGYTFGPVENAPADDVYPAGTVAMARVSNDAESMGSQFFLVYEDSTIPSDSAGGYTVFGKITSGLDFVQAVADVGVEGGAPDGTPANPVTIEGVETQ